MDITIHTTYKANSGGEIFERNVTLWMNKDNTVSLLGNLEHGTKIIVDQTLVDDLQKLVNEINKIGE